MSQGIIGLVVKQHVANGAYGSTILSKGKTLQTRLAGYNLWNKNMRVYARTSNAAITRSNWAGKVRHTPSCMSSTLCNAFCTAAMALGCCGGLRAGVDNI